MTLAACSFSFPICEVGVTWTLLREARLATQVVPAELLRPEPCAAAGHQGMGSPTAWRGLRLLWSLVQMMAVGKQVDFRPVLGACSLLPSAPPTVGLALTPYVQIREKHVCRKFH